MKYLNCVIKLICYLIIFEYCESSNIRRASHSGRWYEDDPKILSEVIKSYLSKSQKQSNNSLLKSIIVPHAGYHFSAPIAAKSFVNINASNYNRVVILGPSHYEYFQGCGLTKFEYFATPLGDIKVDNEYNNKLLKNKNLFFKLPTSVDLKEHSIEMELPFLKYIFQNKNFSIIPIVVGDNDLSMNKIIADELFELYNDPNTLFVISSDFCHWGKNFKYTYYDKSYKNIWESIEQLDKKGIDKIAEGNTKELNKYFEETKNTICGRNPIIIIVAMIEKYKKQNVDKTVKFDLVDYSQSNKVQTFQESSVSYAAMINYIF